MTDRPSLLSTPTTYDGISDRDLLAGLLSFVTPREAERFADDLISVYGDFATILTADHSELARMGLTPHAISLFRTLLPFYGRFLRAEFPARYRFTDIASIGRYFACCFCGVRVETVYLLMLRADKTAIDCRRVAVGSVNSANLNIRALVETALFSGAKYVAIAHNHPGGTASPSSTDLDTTLALKRAFEAIGIDFCDHIIVTGNHYIPVMLSREELFREEDGTVV